MAASEPAMLETPALVVQTEQAAALVEADFGGGCGSGMCAKGGCGAAVLAQLFSRNPRGPMRVGNPIQASIGERVIVGVEEGMLVRSTLVAYLLPLAMLLGGALAGRAWGPGGDGTAAVGALLGLVAGWGLARTLGRHLVQRAQPVILRRA
jgi:sigma-E factor negative regulatory protein RseC